MKNKPRKLFLNQFIQALQSKKGSLEGEHGANKYYNRLLNHTTATNTATDEEEKLSQHVGSNPLASMKSFDKNILIRANNSSHHKRVWKLYNLFQMNIFTPEPRKTEYIMSPTHDRKGSLYRL